MEKDSNSLMKCRIQMHVAPYKSVCIHFFVFFSSLLSRMLHWWRNKLCSHICVTNLKLSTPVWYIIMYFMRITHKNPFFVSIFSKDKIKTLRKCQNQNCVSVCVINLIPTVQKWEKKISNYIDKSSNPLF